jgi:hypothetical protein
VTGVARGVVSVVVSRVLGGGSVELVLAPVSLGLRRLGGPVPGVTIHLSPRVPER